jgi:hypothetical protein
MTEPRNKVKEKMNVITADNLNGNVKFGSLKMYAAKVGETRNMIIDIGIFAMKIIFRQYVMQP